MTRYRDLIVSNTLFLSCSVTRPACPWTSPDTTIPTLTRFPRTLQPRPPAKSLRSKIKRKFRAVRREKIHKPVEDARLQRLAEKAKAELAEQKAAEMETEAVEEQVEEGKEAAEGWFRR